MDRTFAACVQWLGVLSPAQLTQYRHDGYVVVADLLSSAEIATLRERVAQAADGRLASVDAERHQVEPRVAPGDHHADNYRYSLRKMTHLAFFDRVFLEHARNREIPDIVVGLIGLDVKLFQGQRS